MKFRVFHSDGSFSHEAEYTDIPVFEGTKGIQALKEVVVAQAANARLGTFPRRAWQATPLHPAPCRGLACQTRASHPALTRRTCCL